MADAPKILGTDTLRDAYPKLNSAIDNSNEAKTKADGADGKADTAIETANTAKTTADTVQSQFDQVVAEAGSNNPEVVQARGEAVNLNARLNANDAQLAQRAKQSDLELERNRINNLATLTEGSTTGDAELIDGRVGADGVTYSNVGSAIRGQYGKISDRLNNVSARTSYPFDASVTVEPIKRFVTDVYKDNFEAYEYFTLRFADNLADTFGLILYGWVGTVKTIVGRATVQKSYTQKTVSLPLVDKGVDAGVFVLDNTHMSSVLGVITTLIANTNGYRLNQDITSKVSRDHKTLTLESKTDANITKIDVINSYFIDGATIDANNRTRFSSGVTALKIYSKKNISNIALNRLYVYQDIRNLEFGYLKSDGTAGSLLYQSSNSLASREIISAENDDLFIYMVVDWSKTGTVRSTGSYNYQETGFKDKYIIGKAEYDFIKRGSSSAPPTEITSDNITTDLIVCGADATPYQLSVGNAMKALGYGYVCDGTELDTGINNFLDGFMNTAATIRFYGTIRTSKGIHKHPKHNLLGYDCTLKMGDNLGTSYVSNVFPTSGGVPFSTSKMISHNYTFVRGFTFDGNSANNMNAGVYSYKSIYGGAISHEIYNQEISPFSETQLTTDIVLEDIKAVNTLRGIIMGNGWIGRNLRIGDAFEDHALYIAGSNRAIAENVHITGTHKKGAIAISSMSYDEGTRVRNVRLRNIMLDECNPVEGPYLDIRGHFSTSFNNQSLDDIFIDGFFLKKKDTLSPSVLAIKIGTHSGVEVSKDFPTNIHLKNFVTDIRLNNSLFVINNANVTMENASIRLPDYRADKPLFRLQSSDAMFKPFNFDNLKISFDIAQKAAEYTLFGLDNSSTAHSVINGLNINDLTVKGISNYHLFGLIDTNSTNVVTLKNLSGERIIASPLATIKPSEEQFISRPSNDYYAI
jgi:hypothetical protein